MAADKLAVAIGRKKPRRGFDLFGAAGYGYDNAYVYGRKPKGLRPYTPTPTKRKV